MYATLGLVYLGDLLVSSLLISTLFDSETHILQDIVRLVDETLYLFFVSDVRADVHWLILLKLTVVKLLVDC